jgi:EAL domain-containing protein (putative c-di-GMP-specific phosphodiesterase class I)
MDVVAEGVESAEVKDELHKLGCSLGQGWYFGRPSTLQDLVIRYTKTDLLEDIL